MGGDRTRQELSDLGRSGFGDGDTYDAGRPDYPDDVVDHFVATFGIGPGSRVVDLGAGTGKLTRQLLARGPSLVAVEPSPAMRARFARNLPDVPVLDGDDQHLPLPDGSVDALIGHLTGRSAGLAATCAANPARKGATGARGRRSRRSRRPRAPAPRRAG